MPEPDLNLSRGAKAFRLPGFTGEERVWHAFSTRRGGTPPGSVRPAAEAFLASGAFPAEAAPLCLQQVHGAGVHVVDDLSRNTPPRADAAVSGRPGVVLVLQTADCVPVLLADREAGVIGAAHVGWRGALAGVLRNTVAEMCRLGSRPGGMAAALGPAIGRCCFEVGPDVASSFADLDPGLVSREGRRPQVDLPAAAVFLLREAGIPGEAIQCCGLCTRCRTDVFYSHRAEREGAGRLLSGICLIG